MCKHITVGEQGGTRCGGWAVETGCGMEVWARQYPSSAPISRAALDKGHDLRELNCLVCQITRATEIVISKDSIADLRLFLQEF